MPVLAVYEKTSSSSGFSIKSVTRPSSSTVTMPNPEGSSTFLRTRVASAPRSSWKERASVRFTSVKASPETMTNLSPSRSSTYFTEPAVPKGSSSTEYSIFIPHSDPSPK